MQTKEIGSKILPLNLPGKFNIIFFWVSLVAGLLLPIQASGEVVLRGYISNKSAWTTSAPHELSIFRNSASVEGKYEFLEGIQTRATLRLRHETELEDQIETDLELREFVGRYRRKGLDMIVGRQQVVWGKADGLRLLDIINPLDLREFILDDYIEMRIPLWMFRTEYYWSEHSLQILVIPDIEENHLPTPGSRFDVVSTVFPTPPFIIEELKKPDESRLDNWEIGFRWESLLGPITYTLNYLYTWSDTPVYFRELQFNGMVKVSPRLVRYHIYGTSADLPIGETILRAEATYIPQRFMEMTTPDGPGNSREQKQLTYMVGLDWPFGRWLLSPQLFQEIILNPEDDLSRDTINTSVTFLLTGEAFQYRLKFRLFLAYGINESDRWVSPRISYDLGHGLEIALGMDYFAGSQSSNFGRFDDQDRVYLETIWRF